MAVSKTLKKKQLDINIRNILKKYSRNNKTAREIQENLKIDMNVRFVQIIIL